MAAQRRTQVDDRRLSELIKLGTDPEEARAWLAEQEPEEDAVSTESAPCEPLHIWPENAAVFGLFMRLQTQWRYTPRGALDGLRYSAAETVMKRLRMKHRRRLFEQLQEMEVAAVEASHEQH